MSTSDRRASGWAPSGSLPAASASRESAFGSSDGAARGAAGGFWRWFLRLRGLTAAAPEPEVGLEAAALPAPDAAAEAALRMARRRERKGSGEKRVRSGEAGARRRRR